MVSARMSTAVRHLPLLAVALLAACGGKKEEGTRFQTKPVTRGPIEARITASGTLSPLVTVQVGSQVSGRVAELHADFNTVVKKGDLIARIDPRLFEAAVEQARAALAVARGNLAKAKAQAEDAARQAERNRKLVEDRLIAQSEADTTETNLVVARASVEAARGAVTQAEAALNQAELNLFYTKIVSPIDGVVISRSVDVGQTVAASLSSPTLFQIAQDLRQMQVDTSVAEADVGRLSAGMRARFTVDAYPQETFEGTIREIRNAPQTVQNVVTYDAVIDVDNPDLKLKPGMTANVTVTYADRKDVLRVPNPALRFRPPADLSDRPPPAPSRPDERQVWVKRGDGRPQPVTIRVGVSDGNLTEVTAGELKAGDELVIEAISGRKGGPGSFGRVF